MKNVEKDYKKWMGVKAGINNVEPIRRVKTGEIWWAAVGENVGVEIDGKSEKYSRPVLVLKKHNSLCFTGIPLTSKIHRGTWYVNFEFRGKTQTAVLIQAKLVSNSRLYERIGEVSKGDYKRIRDRYIDLFLDKNMP